MDNHSQRFLQNEERAILTVTCLAAFLFFNSFGSIGVALPMIQKQFGNSLSEIQWVVLMGVVTLSSLSFCFGRAGSIFGQRRLYKIGVALYAIGALADRVDAATVAVIGLAVIVGSIAAYSLLAVDSQIMLVAAVLALLGAGIGLFTPANQKVAFAAVGQEDYGVLGAMLSSFGTAAGTIGTTTTVALMEIDGVGVSFGRKPQSFPKHSNLHLCGSLLRALRAWVSA